MGFSTALGFAQAVEEGTVTLDSAVAAHLTSNCFPPVHPDFHPFAVQAIELAREDDWGETLNLPNGRIVTVRSTIAQLHLEAFL